jgi:hypothetical protein
MHEGMAIRAVACVVLMGPNVYGPFDSLEEASEWAYENPDPENDCYEVKELRDPTKGAFPRT